MIVFLYGPDSYRRLRRKRFYVAQFEKKYGLRAEPIDLADADGLVRLETAAKSRSLFAKKKLLVLESISETEPKKLLPFVKMFVEDKDQSLLMAAGKKPVKALDILLKKPVVAEEFEALKGAEWIKFAKQEAKVSGARLAESAFVYLAAAYEGDGWGLVTELRKLAGMGKIVAKADLEAMGIETEKNYFALVQTLRAPNAAQRLGALEILLAIQEPAAKVFHILAALWTQRIGDFARYDQAIKFGRMDYEEALLDLAL
jgi:DNA polymerase III delta subunit